MLQRIRDSLQGQKWLAYGVLGALALVFAAWGAYGVVDLGFGPSNHAAKVNGDTIPVEQVREAWTQQLAQWQDQFGGELPEGQKQLLQNELLEGFVRNTLLTQRANELRYRVTEDQLHKAIVSEPAFQIEGKYSPEVAKARLAQAGITPQAFEADLRSALTRNEVQNAIRVSDFVTPRELERRNALENEQRQIRYALMPAEKFAGDAPVDDAAVKAYYEKNQSQFLTPETVRLQYAELRLDQLAAQVDVTEADARDYYEKNKERYVQPEKRRGSHILIQASQPSEDAAALKEAQDVLAKVKAGGDFAALAKEHSDDPGSAGKGGDLGWAERNYYVGPFADALFSMKEGEIRGPVKTQFGYHIIRLDGIQPGTTKTFEETRGEIEAQLRQDRASDRFGDIQEQIQTKLEEPGTTLDSLAKEFGLQLGEVADFERNVGGGALGNSRDLQDVVFSDAVLAEQRIGGPVAVGEDRLVVVKALEHRKPVAKPLDEVRPQIVDTLKRQRGTEAAIKAAKTARERLEGGASLDDVARELGVTVEAERFVGRTDPSVPAEIRSAAFNAPKPASGKPVVRAVETHDGAGLLVVTDVRVDSGDANPQLQASLKRQVAAQQGMGAVAAYVEELRRTADVSKNPQAFE